MTNGKDITRNYLFELARAAVSGSNCRKYPQGAVVSKNGRVVACGSSKCLLEGTKSCSKTGVQCRHLKSALLDATSQVGVAGCEGSVVTVVDSKTYVSESDVARSVAKDLGVSHVDRFDSEGNVIDESKASEVEVELTPDGSIVHKHSRTYGSSVCPSCGVEFTRTHPRQKYCNRRKISYCKVCGKVFQYTCSGSKPVTCGNPDCVAEARRRNVLKIAKERRKK